MWTSALLKGLCELNLFLRVATHLGIPTITVRASHPTHNIVNGWKVLGFVDILILRREAAITREMIEPGMVIILEKMRAIVEELGTIPVTRWTCEVEQGLVLLMLKRGRERAITWKHGYTLMTTMVEGGELSIVSMRNSGMNRMRCLSSEGTWNTKEIGRREPDTI